MRLGEARGVAATAKSAIDRASLAFFVLAAMALLALARLDSPMIESVRRPVADFLSPVLSVIAEPAATMRAAARDIGELFAIRAENARLREENERLLAWRQRAARLEVENAALREVLAMPPLPEAAPVTAARLVADPGSAFVHTRLIDAGADRAIERGMAVMAQGALVGRIVDVGARSSRLLMLTDFNSRLPVMIERTRDRAILAGDNSERPALSFLPLDPRFRLGDRVITSGDGGVLPLGLPVGAIAEVGEKKIGVRPFVEPARLDHVRIVANRAAPTPETEPAPLAFGEEGALDRSPWR